MHLNESKAGACGMDMHSREQYLAALREEYLRGTKK